MFADRVEVEMIAGRGGKGCMSFRREKHVPRGGPNGGNGGNGGSIILRAERGVNSLVMFAHQKHWRAENGRPGEGSNRHGRSAEDVVLEIPLGTIVIDAQTGLILKDFVAEGDSMIIARGGKGGWGNTHFKSATNQAPRQATDGQEGESRKIVLELKSIADVGLVGMPNAGKSTLLSRLSKARPQIADYPFTTKFPNLGMVAVGHDDGFVMADIPGLIEGCHAGAGLGHEFLRHIVRAGILVHLVEPCPMDGSDPVHNYETIRSELAEYSQKLASRHEIVAVTKAELPEAKFVRDRIEGECNLEVLLISAVTGEGLNQLVHRIQLALDRARSAGDSQTEATTR